jgi:hypothetical protein
MAGSDVPVNITFQIGSIITVRDGQEVGVGEVLARIPQETSKTARHYRRSAAGGGALRSALAEGCGRAGGSHRHGLRSARTRRASSAWSSQTSDGVRTST